MYIDSYICIGVSIGGGGKYCYNTSLYAIIT